VRLKKRIPFIYILPGYSKVFKILFSKAENIFFNDDSVEICFL